MRFFVFLTVGALTASCAGAASAEDTMRVLCQSGTVDESNRLETLTDAVCKAECDARCGSDLNEETLDDCLGEGSLAGCLFTVQRIQTVDLTHCTPSASANVTQVLTLLNKSDLGTFTDGSMVGEVNLELKLGDGSVVTDCGKAVKSGVSLSPFNPAECTVSGTPSLSGQFAEYAAGKSIRVNVTDLFTGVYGSAKDLPVFVQFEDNTCNFTVKEASMLFSVAYKDGYRPSQSCLSTEGCEACLANGCNFCDWSGLTNSLFPEWMPGWLTQLKGDQQGLCGINSALCKTTGGSMSTCGAREAFALGAVALTLLTAHTLLL
eukprot:Gregarina_sp_Pseudo_9__1306@NODE_1873_length_1282_cov_556_210780_g1739_i0_p1_GENE_NODE_1873_length_1282_cov_556_210780_g1739_i0NODE_1873_length_1282_cov_556_210780_g1739_i0_p1_ORF_typecomplete_len320_score104_05He_PIG/PF05345_12/0_12_NODE_1873_length_1282_cov_556_210780_g1739_i01011060